MDNLCIVKGTKHRDLALAWAQLALSPKTQEAYANRIFFGPTNSKAQVPADVAAMIVYGDKVNTLIALDWPYVSSQRSAWTDRWNKELLGK